MINIAWVARDGYLDLLPLVAKRLADNGLDVHNFFLCHTENESVHLSSKYGIENALVLANEIKKIQQTADCSYEHLNSLARKYDALPLVRTLWSTMFETDLKEEEIISQMVSHFEFWEKFLDSAGIDFLFYERPSIMSSSIAWLICNKLGIKSVDFIDTVVNTMTITDSWHGDYSYELRQRMINQKIDERSVTYKKTIKYINMMKERPITTNEALMTGKYTHDQGRVPLKKILSARRLTKVAKQKGNYFIYDSLTKKLKKRIRYILIYNIHRFYNIFDKDFNSKEDRYFLFPLHMSGEWSNHAFMGLGYWDIKSLIKHIAQCLPPGYKLIVKEHLSMFAEHSFKFYKEIKLFRNVKLLSPFENTFQLIKDSKGICTIGSTMGFEGLLLDKPLILFGEPWYRFFPGVYKADTPERVAELFQNVDKLKVPTEEEKIKMVYALFDISFNAVRMPQPNALTFENIASLADAFSKYIARNKSNSIESTSEYVFK